MMIFLMKNYMEFLFFGMRIEQNRIERNRIEQNGLIVFCGKSQGFLVGINGIVKRFMGFQVVIQKYIFRISKVMFFFCFEVIRLYLEYYSIFQEVIFKQVKRKVILMVRGFKVRLREEQLKG